VHRLARALGTTAQDLLPNLPSPDTHAVLEDQAKSLFEDLLQVADRGTFLILNPLLRLLVAAKKK
jgi:hypothetical protein